MKPIVLLAALLIAFAFLPPTQDDIFAGGPPGNFSGTWETLRCSEGTCPFGLEFSQKHGGLRILAATIGEAGVSFSFSSYAISGEKLIDIPDQTETGWLRLRSLFVGARAGEVFRASIDNADQLSFEGHDGGGRTFRGVAIRSRIR